MLCVANDYCKLLAGSANTIACLTIVARESIGGARLYTSRVYLHTESGILEVFTEPGSGGGGVVECGGMWWGWGGGGEVEMGVYFQITRGNNYIRHTPDLMLMHGALYLAQFSHCQLV